MLEDIDQLIFKCRSERARQHISDAYRAYRGGAYRSAIVSCWIAYVFDFIDKINELSNAGDAQALEVKNEFESIQEQIRKGDPNGYVRSLKFEREILNRANRKFEFIDDQALTDLGRLRDDRNRCAHPSFQIDGNVYHPTSELARMHIVNVVNHSLSEPPRYGKSLIDRIKRECAATSFPLNVSDSKKYLSSIGFERPKAALTKGVVDMLSFGMFDADGALYMQRRPTFALGAVIEIDPAIGSERVKDNFKKIIPNLDEKTSCLIVPISRFVPPVREVIQDGDIVRALGSIELLDGDTSAEYYAYSIEVNIFRDHVIPIVQKMDEDAFGNVLNYSADELLIDEAISRFLSSKSWISANRMYDKFFGNVIYELDADKLELIFSSARNGDSDLIGSHALSIMIKDLNDNDSSIDRDSFHNLLEKFDLRRYIK